MKIDRDALKTRIPIIDSQHDSYFDSVEQLFEMYQKRDVGPGDIREVLNKIQEYAQDNFDTEEQMMENEGYPAMDQHRSKHDRFKKSIDGYFEELEGGPDPREFIERLRHLLVVWFESQIKKDDVALATFLKKRGYGKDAEQ